MVKGIWIYHRRCALKVKPRYITETDLLEAGFVFDLLELLKKHAPGVDRVILYGNEAGCVRF
jgi:hypothetical protein